MAATFAQFETQVLFRQPTLAFVLGSGMSHVPAGFQEESAISFADVPGLSGSSVQGHSGQIALGTCVHRPILLFRGRLHYYEGHSWETVGRPVTMAAGWGIKNLILTNAAGGIRDDLNPGSLMALTNHFGWLSPTAWKTQVNSGSPRPSIYSQRLIALMVAADPEIAQGVYGGVTGPCYETPAEIRALHAAGADAVGMSTVREAITAQELGVEVGGLSLITNKAAGLTGEKLNHKEVLETAKKQELRLSRLIENLCRSI